MSVYETKPTFIEAVQFTGWDSSENPIFTERPEWLERALTRGQSNHGNYAENTLWKAFAGGSPVLTISFYPGGRRVPIGSYIVWTPAEELLSIEEAVFNELYSLYTAGAPSI